MKKITFGAALIACLILAASCKSTAKDKYDDSDFQDIYNENKSGLILTGASKYTVKKGDTLVKISQTFYGDAYYYPVIMLASSEVVKDPDKIVVGTQLTIPDIKVNLDDANAKARIKNLLLEFADVEQSRKRASTSKNMRDKANKL